MTGSRILALAVVFVASACASQTAQSPDGTSPANSSVAPRGSADVISPAELSDPSLGDLDALSIIKRLRPAFLATRGGAAGSANSPVTGMHVTIAGGPLQPIDALTTIHASEMLEIRYLNAAAAAQAYGSAAGAAGVIVIKRR